MPKYITIKTKYSDNDDMAKLPLMEFAYGSLLLSRRQALIELGFPEEKVDDLMEERLAEDLVQDPVTRKALGEAVVKDYKKELHRED
jgi:hypothetical protein